MLRILELHTSKVFSKMTGKIKLFRNVRKFHRMVGIYPPAKHHQQPFNAKNIFVLLSMALFLISEFWYFLFNASSIEEYGQCFYGSISMLEISLYFIVNFSKMKSILKLIRNFENFIEMSKLNFPSVKFRT